MVARSGSVCPEGDYPLPMSALVWLTIPAAALVLGVLWVVWASRTRPRADTHETVEAHERFRAAFNQPPAPTQRHHQQHRDSA